MRRRRRRASGFTLPELMAVVVIVGVMGAVAMATLTGATSGNGAGALARSLQFSLMSARTSALADGTQRRVNCNLAASSYAGYCDFEKLCVPGMSPTTTGCSTVWNREQRINFGTHGTVWNITSTTDNAANNAGASQVTGAKTFIFYPDGSIDPVGATGATLYVADPKGTNKGNQFKIYVYSTTGMARLVNTW